MVCQSHMSVGEVYFWTNTINNWNNLLSHETLKLVIINQLQWLIKNNKIKVYGYVIMPNHMHILWEMVEKNGKEMPHASFNKWTGSRFLIFLRDTYPKRVWRYYENTKERNHRFWQRDALAIKIWSRGVFEQKLEYIHLNPLQERWNLVKKPEDYRWSSAAFYENGVDEFGILTHYYDRF